MNVKTPNSDLRNSIDIEESLDRLAALAGIDIPESNRAMVAVHLSTAAGMADIVYSAPFTAEEYESAAVFLPAELPGDESK